MKITVREASVMIDCLESRMSSLEYYVTKYDDEGNRMEGVVDTEVREYPEYITVKELLTKLKNAEV